jgi:hypothetical protein
MSTMFLRISLHKKGLQIVAKGCRRVGLLCELMGQSERVQQTGPDSIEQSADHRWKIVLCLRPVSWGYPLYMCFWVQSGGLLGIQLNCQFPTCPPHALLCVGSSPCQVQHRQGQQQHLPGSDLPPQWASEFQETTKSGLVIILSLLGKWMSIRNTFLVYVLFPSYQIPTRKLWIWISCSLRGSWKVSDIAWTTFKTKFVKYHQVYFVCLWFVGCGQETPKTRILRSFWNLREVYPYGWAWSYEYFWRSGPCQLNGGWWDGPWCCWIVC